MTSIIKDLPLQEVWEKIMKELAANSEPYADKRVIYQFDIFGEEEGTFQLSLSDGEAKLEQGSPNEASCILSMNINDFKKLLVGELNSTMAYMTGKLRVKGNLGLALELERMLKKYTF